LSLEGAANAATGLGSVGQTEGQAGQGRGESLIIAIEMSRACHTSTHREACLLQCLRCAVSGKAYCSPRVMTILISRFAALEGRLPRPYPPRLSTNLATLIQCVCIGERHDQDKVQ
jgi:hypothetical protein